MNPQQNLFELLKLWCGDQMLVFRHRAWATLRGVDADDTTNFEALSQEERDGIDAISHFIHYFCVLYNSRLIDPDISLKLLYPEMHFWAKIFNTLVAPSEGPDALWIANWWQRRVWPEFERVRSAAAMVPVEGDPDG